jgi:hypothetical protein
MTITRRQLLAGSSAAVLMPKSASARFRHDKASSSGAFNGHKVGMNLYVNDYPFLNCFKTAAMWQVDPGPVDANGYPSTVIPWYGPTCAFTIPTTANRPGTYILKGRGSGNIKLQQNSVSIAGTGNGINVVDSGSGWRLPARGTPGDGIGFAIPSSLPSPGTPSTTMNFFINSNAHAAPNNIRDIVCCHADDEAALLRGEMFRKRFSDPTLMLARATRQTSRLFGGKVSHI